MAKKPSLFSRALDKLKTVWRKEEKAHPRPKPESSKKEKESWLRRRYSDFVEASPWRQYKKTKKERIQKQIRKLESELKELEKPSSIKEVDMPVVQPVKPEEPIFVEPKEPSKFLIEEPEFQDERAKAFSVFKDIKEKIESFAEEPPAGIPDLYVDINHGMLPFGALIVSATFQADWTNEELRYVMLGLENVLHENEFQWFPFRVSLAGRWNPSDVKELNFRDGQQHLEYVDADGKKRDSAFNMFNGYLDVPMNVSGSVAYSFATARDDLFPKVNELFGTETPEQFTMRLVWGVEPGMKLGRNKIKI